MSQSPDILSIAVFAVDQLLEGAQVNVLPVKFAIHPDFGWMVEIAPKPQEDKSVTRTAAILSEMRAENAAALSKASEISEVRRERRINRARRTGVWARLRGNQQTTSRLTEEQHAARTILLKGLKDETHNDTRKNLSAARFANSVASSRKRITPDNLECLLAFFVNPSAFDSFSLAGYLPALVSQSRIKETIADPFVIDVVEGLGFEMPTAVSLGRMLNSTANRNHEGRRGRKRKVRTVTTFGHGHRRPYVSEALPMGRIPGGNDVMHGDHAARRLAG